MTMRPTALLALLLPAACASQTGFPSLAERPVERALSGKPAPPCAVAGDAAVLPSQAVPTAAAAANDPALPARLRALTVRARNGAAAFTAARAEAERTTEAAGAVGSESWVAAQVALSRLEAARAPTTAALGELDQMLLTGARTASPDDLAAIGAALGEVQGLAEDQAGAIAALNARVPSD